VAIKISVSASMTKLPSNIFTDTGRGMMLIFVFFDPINTGEHDANIKIKKVVHSFDKLAFIKDTSNFFNIVEFKKSGVRCLYAPQSVFSLQIARSDHYFLVKI
jgi:hypothetical protein